MKFNEFLKLLPKIENISLPAETSHFKMVPPSRKVFAKYNKTEIENAKQAGVLALFYPAQTNETTFILILRKTYKGVHSAQVSFPGGKVEDVDVTLKDTAVRETYEEVGVPIKHIQVIANMSQVYIPPSNFFVQPYLGITEKRPLFKKQDNEVEQLIEVKLQDLIDDKNIIMQNVETSYNIDVEVPAFQLNGFTVWGATAMVLSEIKDVIKQLV